MNPEMEKELETEMSLALKGMPDLAAPAGLLGRTMRALEKPAPWRLKPWSGWAFSARIAFLVVALAAVVVGFAEFRAVEPSLVAEASRHLSPVAAGCASFWNVLRALAGALALGAEHLGKGFMLAGLVAVIGACAVCAGFGAIFVRLAWSGQGKNQL